MNNKCGQTYLFMHKTTKKGSDVALIPLLCKSWSCSICRPKKADQVKLFIRKNFSKRKVWMLTFTYNHRGTALNAWRGIGNNLNRMLSYARKYNEKFSYVRVVEPHKDGSWPHIHMLVDKDICSNQFVKMVTEWGFGWNFHCEPMDGAKASNYMAKYLTKEWPDGDADLLRQISKTRIVSSSRELGPIFAGGSDWKVVQLPNPWRQIPYLRKAVVSELHKQFAFEIVITPINEGFYLKSDAILSPLFFDSISDPLSWDSCDEARLRRSGIILESSVPF